MVVVVVVVDVVVVVLDAIIFFTSSELQIFSKRHSLTMVAKSRFFYIFH